MTETPSRRIDAHHHVWDLEVRDQPWTRGLPNLRRSFSMAELRPQVEVAEIDATIVVQTVCTPAETPELLALATKEPLIAGVVGWLDLTCSDVRREVDRLRELPGGNKLVGIRHQVQLEHDPTWLDRPDVRKSLADLGRAGIVYDLLVTSAQLPAAVRAARALPEVRFVLDHGGKPAIAIGLIEPWRRHVRGLAQLPNVAVKLSGLVTEASPAGWTVAHLRPYAEVLLNAFTPARTMFGSDWPVCTLAASYAEVLATAGHLTAGLSADEHADVFGQTAARWYGIPA